MIRSYNVPLERECASANVVDMYKDWVVSEVRADLDKNRSCLVNVCMNLTNDFNKASVIRANNAFLGRAVYLVGRRQYNRRGTVGTHNYEHVYSADSLSEVLLLLKSEGYVVFGVDNTPCYDPVNLWDCFLPEKSVFVYGEEGRGLSSDEIGLCDRVVFIQQVGSVRSLNIAQAASCVMSEYSRRYR